MADTQTNGHDKKAARRWTPERTARFKATMAAKRKERERAARKPREQKHKDHHSDDAIVYLRQAMKWLQRHPDSRNPANNLAELALNALQGEL